MVVIRIPAVTTANATTSEVVSLNGFRSLESSILLAPSKGEYRWFAGHGSILPDFSRHTFVAEYGTQ